ncbi:hypothetical protein Tco_1363442 [Tanacetum coccineum]
MLNNIMADGSKDRLHRCLDQEDILSGYSPVETAAENILPVAAHEEAETYTTWTAENKLYFHAEKEAIFLILNGIGMEIYSNCCAATHRRRCVTAIEGTTKGKSFNGTDFLQQLHPEWSRFVTVVKQRQEIDTVSYHKLFDVLKQFQNEVNDIPFWRLARSGKSISTSCTAGMQEAKAVKGLAYHKGEVDDVYKTMMKLDVFTMRRHSEQPESINDTYVLEKDDSNVIPDSSNICTNDNQVDQNAAECVDERAALANLIANLTLDTEENKTVLKQFF